MSLAFSQRKMDRYCSLPVAKRTRAKEDEYLRKMVDKLKAKENGGKIIKGEGCSGMDCLNENRAKEVVRVVLDGSDSDSENGCIVVGENWNLGDDIEGKEFICVDNEDEDEDEKQEQEDDGCSEVGENNGFNSGFIKSESKDSESNRYSKDSESNHCSATVGNRTASVDEERSSGVGDEIVDLQQPHLFENSVDCNGSGSAGDAIVLESSESEKLESSSEEGSASDDNDYDAENSEDSDSDFDDDVSSEEEEEEELIVVRKIARKQSGDERSGDAKGKINEEGGKTEYYAGERWMQTRLAYDDRGDVCDQSRALRTVLPTKIKRAATFKEEEVVKILVNSILSGKAELNLEEKREELMPTPPKTSTSKPSEDDLWKELEAGLTRKEEIDYEMPKEEKCARPVLPDDFRYGPEKPLPREKTEEEKEEERLWQEMDLCLCADGDTVEGLEAVEAATPVDAELDVHTRCAQGKHDLTLDDEIGVKCRFCSYVDVEIRHYVAPFQANSRIRAERRELNDDILDFFGNIDPEDFACESKGSDPYIHAEKTVWDLIPEIRKGLHPHQQEGLEFLWKNLEGGINLDELKQPRNSSRDSGCIISHAPGTGKTRLAIVFICSYMKLFPACRPLIIAPCSMLPTWEGEFQKWGLDFPLHNLNHSDLSGKENPQALKLLSLVRTEQRSSDIIRMVKLFSWKSERSVLVVSYQLFEKLVGEEKKSTSNEVRKILLDLPGLLVLDEGHTPRNDSSRIFDALSRVRTKKRIILSGTPFQNNLDELYNIIILARPNFEDSISSKHNECFSKKRKISKAKGTWATLTDPIGKAADYSLAEDRLEEVRAIIKPVVHVYRGSILQEQVPGLKDYVILLQPDDIQEELINKIERMRNMLSNLNFFKWEHALCSVCVHPSLLEKSALVEGLDIDWKKLERIRLNPEYGVKMKFILEFIRLCEAINERVLIFSQFIPPLKLMIKYLRSRFGWSLGREFLYMHGRLSVKERESLRKKFNNEKSEAKVMLASTKASCEGINLTGASRVVLLDVLWNPAVRSQAISRAYRLGQEKVVYAYHLIAAGSAEEEKYGAQARKEQLSELVFYSADEQFKHQETLSKFSEDKEDKVLEELIQREKLKCAIKEIRYEQKDSKL